MLETRIYPKRVSIEVSRQNLIADFYFALESMVVGAIRIHQGARLLTPVGLGKVGSGNSILIRAKDSIDYRGVTYMVYRGIDNEPIAQIDGSAQEGGGTILIEWERDAEPFIKDFYLVLHELGNIPLPDWVAGTDGTQPTSKTIEVGATTPIDQASLQISTSKNTDIAGLGTKPARLELEAITEKKLRDSGLTNRQVEVAVHLIKGLQTDKAIAKAMGNSVRPARVRQIRDEIVGKLKLEGWQQSHEELAKALTERFAFGFPNANLL